MRRLNERLARIEAELQADDERGQRLLPLMTDEERRLRIELLLERCDAGTASPEDQERGARVRAILKRISRRGSETADA